MSRRSPRAVALLLLALVILSLVLGPMACLHQHEGFDSDPGCAVCAHVLAPALLPEATLGCACLLQVVGCVVASAPRAQHDVAALSRHAPRGPPAIA